MNTRTDFIGNIVAEDFRAAAIFKKTELISAVKAEEVLKTPATARRLIRKKFIWSWKRFLKMMVRP